MELTMFVHFSLNTFYEREWGNGTESLTRFNPLECDPDQWVRVIAGAGAKLAILTCKHHGGFCLWPSSYTDYSVKNTPWKNGKGDIVKEFSEACRKHHVKFGVYLSPWDRHDERYGVDSDAYNEYFVNQLKELLTQYGPVSAVWFDGACCPVNGKLQHYDWERYYSLIRTLQPECVISGIAPDIRWCGNESGRSRPAEWSVINLTKSYLAFNHENCAKPEIGELGNGENLVWYPAEVDTSIRPNWFYHKSDDSEVKSLKKLIDIYFNSVGHNSVLLLNLPPDQRGLIHENDIKRIQEWTDALKYGFSENLLKDAVVSASSRRPGCPVGNILDDRDDTCWEAEPWTPQAMIEFKFPEPRTFNCIMLQENIAAGQRVEEYEIEINENGVWKSITSGQTIGYKELKRFDSVTCTVFRLNIVSARYAPTLKKAAAYNFPVIEEEIRGTFDLIYPGWNTKIAAFSSEDHSAPAARLYEENGPYSSDPLQNLPQHIVLELNQLQTVIGAILLPQQDDSRDGLIADFSLAVSVDGNTWTTAHAGELGNLQNNPCYQKIFFEKTYEAIRYIRLEVFSTFGKENYFKLQRFFVITGDARKIHGE